MHQISSRSEANALIFWSGRDEDIHHNQSISHFDDTPADSPDTPIDTGDQLETKSPHGKYKRTSAYVDLFETMVRTVVEHEVHLLSDSEMNALKQISEMSYNARYLLVRLSLRKPDKWHRLSSLNYQSEMGDADCIATAIQELSWDAKMEAEASTVKQETEEREIIDLTLDNDEELVSDSLYQQNLPSPVKHDMPILQPDMSSSDDLVDFTDGAVTADYIPEIGPDVDVEIDHDLTVLADDESKMSLSDLLNCLTIGELRGIARQMKIKTTQTRTALVSALLTLSTTQSIINFPAASDSKGKHKADHNQMRLTFPIPGSSKVRVVRTQGERLREIILEVLVKCIRINRGLFKLFKRIDLVYFRSTEYTQTLLTPALLARFRKRFYPSYSFTRTPNIWGTRDELLRYEAALALEASIVGLIDGTSMEAEKGISGGATAIPARGGHVFVTPVTPGVGRIVGAQTHTPTPIQKDLKEDKEDLREGVDGRGKEEVEVEEIKPESAKMQHARRVREIFVGRVYPRWKEFVQERHEVEEASREKVKRDGNPKVKTEGGGGVEVKAEERGVQIKEECGNQDSMGIHWDSTVKRVGLERFDCGHVYTRMVQKCARVLGMLKDHQFELEVVENLLAQRWWQKGRRGKWHERRTLILMTHCGRGEATMRRAMDAVVEALQDDDTHIIYRAMLVRRLARLEKKLKVPPEECHHCEGRIQESPEVYLEGVRVRKRAESLVLDLNRRPATPVTPIPVSKAWGALSPMSARIGSVIGSPFKDVRKMKNPESWRSYTKGKSVWRGQNEEEVNVENFALQRYELLGYKGFHSEGSIVRTIFGLLFFDIIFASIPGAFETPYQSAPLDIAEDAFYYARKDLIEARLLEIEADGAKEIVERCDTEHREKGTWCVGVRWDLFERQDLLEIVQCLGGKPLSAICRLFCEDYSARGSGIPDLFLWNAKKNTCRFVEVKGPGDSLQENQKLWIDILLRSGIPVEVCHVSEKGKIGKQRKRRRRRGSSIERTKTHTVVVDLESDTEVVLESEDDADEGKPGPSLPRMVVVEAEQRGRKRFAEDELPVFASAPSPESRKKMVNRAEVVILTPSKKRRTGWQSSP